MPLEAGPRILSLRATPRVPSFDPLHAGAPVPQHPTPMAMSHRHTPDGTDVLTPSSGDMTHARWVEEPTLFAERRRDGDRMAIVLVRCAPPSEILESAAMSELTPCPHPALLSWDAYWAGDERYMLRGQRWDGGVEWYTVTLACTAAVPTPNIACERSRADLGAPASRVRTMLIGWRPCGSRRTARWTIAWRRP